MGFETYLALPKQELGWLNDNIFKNIENSEYLLFIDFRRELLSEENKFRGSLFSNQELAIASFLNLEAIAFQQERIIEEDGMLRYMKLNPIIFKDESELYELIPQKIAESKWKKNWKNALKIIKEPPKFRYTHLNIERDKDQEPKPGLLYYIRVRNLHNKKPAFDCAAYVEKIVNLKNKQEMDLETIELKWLGSREPYVTIVPKLYRDFFAFYILDDEPNKLHFSRHSDSTEYLKPLEAPIDIEITYVVYSRDFHMIKETYTINFKNRENIKIDLKE